MLRRRGIYLREVIGMLRARAVDLAEICGLLFITAGLVVFPSELISAAKSGVELCLTVMLPSLFPFFVLSNLSVRLGFADKLGKALAPVMRPVFNVSGAGAAALALGFVGGYPVGAKTVISLYKSGRLTKTEAERMLAYANNSGPAFILGVVGTGIFAERGAGLALYLVHALSSLIIGILFRFYKRGEKPEPASAVSESRESAVRAFIGSVGDGLGQCLSISAFVLFFAVFIRLLFLSGAVGAAAERLSVFGLPKESAESLITGAIELTSGVWKLREIGADFSSRLALAAFMLGWAGLSVHCQVLSFIEDSGLRKSTYFAGKLLHGVLSAAIIWLANMLGAW